MRYSMISQKISFGIIGGLMCLIAIYLYVWTVLDPLYLKKQMALPDCKTESVSVYIDCNHIKYQRYTRKCSKVGWIINATKIP